MSSDVASRYYGSLVGAWSGSFAFAITDRAALRGATSSTRVRMAAMGVARALAGAPRMATTLAANGARAFVHTTRVTQRGVLLFESTEEIAIDDDGRSFRMAGAMRSWPGAPERYEATGAIDASATRAEYRIPWFGVELLQRTHIVDEGLELTQDGPWSRADVLLRRA